MNYTVSLFVTQQCGRIPELNGWTLLFDNFLFRRIVSCSPKDNLTVQAYTSGISFVRKTIDLRRITCTIN